MSVCERLGWRLWLGLVLVGLMGCADEEGVAGPCPEGRIRCVDVCVPVPEASLEYIQAEIFDVSCNVALCHGASRTQEELLLTDLETSYENLVDQPSVQRDGAVRVVPGDPGASYLMNKLTGVDMAPRSSDNEPTEVMPSGPEELCQAQIDIIRDWIAGGAPRTGVAD